MKLPNFLQRIIDNEYFFPLLVISLVGLSPLLWFSSGQIIAGHDSGLPLNPIVHFMDRLSTWTERYGIGADQSFAIGGFFVHGIEALISLLGFSLTLEQYITFIFWFALPGFAFYYLGNSVSAEKRYKYAWLIGSIFYMYNHFLLQGWFIAERTKFSLYIALPLVLAFLIKVYLHKISPLRGALFVGLVLFFLNGGGFIPLYGAIFISWLTALVYFIYITPTKENIKRLLSFTLLSVVITILLDSFWFIPYLYNTLHSYSNSLAIAGGIDGVKGWIQTISQNTTYNNLLRLQGIQEWYVNPVHPYAKNYLENPILIMVSFILPILAYMSIIFIKDTFLRRFVLFFGLLSLVGMVFSAGSQPPFGVLYLFLVEHLPGFAIFRTPFYKFAPALWIAYSFLIGVTINYLLLNTRFLPAKFLKLAVGGVVLAIVAYSFPFMTGVFFDYEPGVKTTRVTYPAYINTFNQNLEPFVNQNNRILLVPELSSNLNIEAYDWGYWSLASVTSLMSNVSFISNNSSLEEPEKNLVNIVYTKLLAGDPIWTKAAAMLSIDGFLVRRDFQWDQKNYETAKPEEYEKKLIESGHVTKKFEDGDWVYYEYKNKGNQFYISNKPVMIQGTPKDLDTLITIPEITADSVPVFLSSNKPVYQLIDDKFPQRVDISTATCVKCNVTRSPLYLPGVDTFGVGSRFYGYQKGSEEKEYLTKKTTEGKLNYLKSVAYKRFVGVRTAYFEKKSLATKIEAINEFNTYLDRLESLITENPEGEQISYNNSLVIFNDELTQLVSYIDELYSAITDNVEEASLYQTLTRVELLMKKTDQMTWKTEDQANKRYIFNIPRQGDYKLLLYKDTANSSNQILTKSNMNLILDGRQASVSASLKQNTPWIETEKIKLTQGVHRLLVNDGISVNSLENQLKDTVVEDGVQIKDGTLTLTSTGVEKCMVFQMPADSDGKSIYKFEFSYMKVSGDQDLVFYASEGSGVKSTLSKRGVTQLTAEVYEQKYYRDMFFKKEHPSTSHICTKLNRFSTTQTILKVFNIALRRVTNPYVALLGGESNPTALNSKIEVSRESNTHYNLTAANSSSSLLVFSDKYDPYWSLSSGNTSLDTSHLMAIGSMNAWVLDSGDQKLVLDYKPQSIFIKSLFLTLLSLIGVVGLLWRTRR